MWCRGGEHVTCHRRDIHDLFPEFRAEIEQFFQVYKQLERKKIATRGFGNRAEALEVIAAARERLTGAGQTG